MIKGNLLAIKTIKIQSTTKEKVKLEIASMKKEIGILKKLDHPNIIKYFDFQLTEDLTGVDIILEFVSGGSLRSCLNKFGQFDEKLVQLYTQQILEGIRYIHSHSVIHRDIKAANILLNTDGVIKLTDFGTSTKITTPDSEDQE